MFSIILQNKKPRKIHKINKKSQFNYVLTCTIFVKNIFLFYVVVVFGKDIMMKK